MSTAEVAVNGLEFIQYKSSFAVVFFSLSLPFISILLLCFVLVKARNPACMARSSRAAHENDLGQL